MVSSSPATSSAAPVSTLRTVLTTGLRPQQLLLQPMQPPAYRVVTQTSSNTVASANPATIIPDNDPSLDENLLNILAADGLCFFQILGHREATYSMNKTSWMGRNFFTGGTLRAACCVPRHACCVLRDV